MNNGRCDEITDGTRPVVRDLASGRELPARPPSHARPDTRSGPAGECDLSFVGRDLASRRARQTTPAKAMGIPPPPVPHRRPRHHPYHIVARASPASHRLPAHRPHRTVRLPPPAPGAKRRRRACLGAPKVRPMGAQGNALGIMSIKTKALKGRAKEGVCQTPASFIVMPPLQGLKFLSQGTQGVALGSHRTHLRCSRRAVLIRKRAALIRNLYNMRCVRPRTPRPTRPPTIVLVLVPHSRSLFLERGEG
jgi:hypothetical protein